MSFSSGQVLTAAELNAVVISSTTATAYTPAVANGGSATFTTLTGWYFEIGASLVFFTAYFVVNAGGSGSTSVTITSPTNPDRTTRQVITGVRETSSTTRSEGVLVAFTGGSGAVWDNMVFGAAILKGSDLAAASLHVFTGWYRTA